MPKNPFIKFYPADWISDQALQQCSMAARGLWIEIVCRMASFDGVLPNNILVNQILNQNPTGLVNQTDNQKVNQSLLEELERFGVFSRNKKGEIFSRRMVRDFELSKKRYSIGKKGGNPILVNQKLNQTVNQNSDNLVNQKDNLRILEARVLEEEKEKEKEAPAFSGSGASNQEAAKTEQPKPTKTRAQAYCDEYGTVRYKKGVNDKVLDDAYADYPGDTPEIRRDRIRKALVVAGGLLTTWKDKQFGGPRK